ncbi:hypothetical protein GBA52_023793 [Prunus armeniaca]|nr:hypothetical protein GBA52_023793 [Prunus armeniaca]
MSSVNMLQATDFRYKGQLNVKLDIEITGLKSYNKALRWAVPEAHSIIDSVLLYSDDNPRQQIAYHSNFKPAPQPQPTVL